MSSFHIVPGDPDSSVVIHVPHSSRAIPADVRPGILLDDDALERELDAMTDAFTDVIAERAAQISGCRPWLFVNDLSRFVVDPERFPDDREEMNAVGMGAVYTRTSGGAVLRDLPDDEISGLVDRFFTPYADALSGLVDERLSSVGEVTIIDLHSYPRVPNPYELHAGGRRPEVCLGTDEFHTPPALGLAVSGALAAVTPTGDVSLDSPFSGCYVPLKYFGTLAVVHALMIEIRRDLYLDAHLQLDQVGVTPLVSGVAATIDAADDFAGAFTLHHDVQSVLAAFGVADGLALAARLRREAGLDPSRDFTVYTTAGLYLQLDGHRWQVSLPVSTFDLIDMTDHLRHLVDERQTTNGPDQRSQP